MSDSQKTKHLVKTVAAVALILAAIGTFYVMVIRSDAGNDLSFDVNNPTLIDEQGNIFSITARPGQTVDSVNPKSGKQGYPTEWCFWNKDGSLRAKPFPVLLNLHIGKPGPTFCPDCGRLVVGHNPEPVAGMKPAPTREEYEARHASGGSGSSQPSR